MVTQLRTCHMYCVGKICSLGALHILNDLVHPPTNRIKNLFVSKSLPDPTSSTLGFQPRSSLVQVHLGGFHQHWRCWNCALLISRDCSHSSDRLLKNFIGIATTPFTLTWHTPPPGTEVAPYNADVFALDNSTCCLEIVDEIFDHTTQTLWCAALQFRIIATI